MANIVTFPLPHDLPENWNENHYVTPGGTEVGLTPQHGYNYLMQQVNNSQKAINELDAFLQNLKFAPSGFGLGEENGKTISSYSEITGYGFYRLTTESGLCPTSNVNWGAVFLGPNIKWGTLVASCSDGYVALKSVSDGVWNSDWEWVNPPMVDGTEYRTSERIGKKTVFKKNVSGVIYYRIDGQSDWKPYAYAIGATPSTVAPATVE